MSAVASPRMQGHRSPRWAARGTGTRINQRGEVASGGGGGPVYGFQEFTYTGDVQEFVVPLDATSLTVDMAGAQGQTGTNSDGQTGGFGGGAFGQLAVTPGETLYIYVGASNGYNGGGAPGNGGAGAHGGGATDIRRSGTSLDDRIVIASGGGASGNWDIGNESGPAGGGNGDGDGQSASLDSLGTDTVVSGQGGTTSAGGAAATGYYNLSATAGSKGQGGSSGGANDGALGGPGGGGLYGGGGGSLTISGSTYYLGSGGAGSGLSDILTDVSAAEAINPGDGYCNFEWNA